MQQTDVPSRLEQKIMPSDILASPTVSKRSMITDAIILIRKLVQTSAEMDRFGIIDTLNTENRSIQQEFRQDQETLARLMNGIYKQEKKMLLYERTFLTDLEFALNILNCFYIKYFNEFMASPGSIVTYRGLRSSFKIYDVCSHRMRVYILDRTRAFDQGMRQTTSNRSAGGIIEKEKVFRDKLMRMSRSDLMPPVVFSALIPVFHGAGVLDHMQYVVEHNEYKQLTAIRRDAAMSASSLDADWDNILNTTTAQTQSKPSHLIINDLNNTERPRAMGSIAKDMGLSFVYAMLIPHRMSTTLRSALLQRNSRIDNSLGPEIQILFSSIVANDFITYDFTLEDIYIELREDGAIKRVLLGYLDFYQNFDTQLTRKDIPGPNRNPLGVLHASSALFSLLFYCSALIQTFRLNIAGTLLSTNTNSGYASSFIPQDPLIAYIHVAANGSVSVAADMLKKVMNNKHTSAQLHITKILRLWYEARERTGHLQQYLHRIIQPSSFTPGSLEDLLTTMLSQYESVSFRV